MASRSHSYVVGVWGTGGVLAHNPREAPSDVAGRLEGFQSTETPGRYNLRYRNRADHPPAETSRGRSAPVLPEGIPPKDEDGNWLIYLYEEDTPAVVENARYGIQMGRPWRLTYNPAQASVRRTQSTGRYIPQWVLLQLAGAERGGPRGATGQLDCDEYPPAMAEEGGAEAVVAYIEAGDNRRAGSLMARQFRAYKIQCNDRFRYAIIHGNLTGIEYLGDDLMRRRRLNHHEIERTIVAAVDSGRNRSE